MNNSTRYYISIKSLICVLAGFLTLIFATQSYAQTKAPAITGHGKTDVQPFYNDDVFGALQFRNIGPYRGGRSIAVAGDPENPFVYYAGYTGGGVYKTTDAGKSWFNISDEYFKTGAVGALEVSQSDPNIIFAGMGEDCIRGNIATGDGVYKSTDAGKTWQWMGLGETAVVADIEVDPDNPKIVWAAALGDIFGKKGNEERGVYKSTDGGKTWEKVLYLNKHTGAVSLEIDPNNSRILYAGMWEAWRTPWGFSSGGSDSLGYHSGIYKSTDGGDTWTNITKSPGLPKGIIGKTDIAISKANSNIVYALIEAENGGLFRSDNGGETWQLVNNDAKLLQRAWYYIHLYVDPENPDKVYVLNVGFNKSIDGGKTFTSVRTPHGDHHDLWIDSDNPDRMIVADDGGGQVSLDGGTSWSSYMNISTAQFYHVYTDDQFPYRLYGAQQDNSTVSIKNRTAGYGITEQDWHGVGGGESGFIAPVPGNPDIVFAGSYGGLLTKYNVTTSENNVVSVWPDNPMGHGASDLRDRFQWTYPIHISPLKPKALYSTSQYVYVSRNLGHSWERISPDLTRNEKEKQQPAGGPLTKDNTSIEYYNTIFSFGISPQDTSVIWAGADDGLVHVTRNNGKTWENVTPPALKAGKDRARINSIDPSPYNASGVYVAATRYKQGKFEPLLFKSKDYGKHWTQITNGIHESDYTRVVRADPYKKGLLFAGTATGLYISFNDGKKWQRFQLNLPNVSITDLKISQRDKDLVLSTKGRGFYILDDLPVIEQLSDKIAQSKAHLFKPDVAYQLGSSFRFGGGGTVGQNPSRGPNVYYYLNGVSKDANVQLQFLKDGHVIQTYSNKYTAQGKPVKPSNKYYENKDRKSPGVLTDNQGLNKFTWNMRYSGISVDLKPFPVWWGGSRRGPEAVPGTYAVRLKINDRTVSEQNFEIKSDPRETANLAELQEQFDLVETIQTKVDSVLMGIKRLREARDQINEQLTKVPESSQTYKNLVQTKKQLTVIENKLTQPRSKAGEDPLNYPIRLDNKLAAVASTVMRGKTRPTVQQHEVYQMLAKQADKQLEILKKILSGQIIQNFEELEGEPIKINSN